MTRRWQQRPQGSTWGDFGADDQRGRMNLLTPERVRAAAVEVREGRTFCLSLPLDLPGGTAVNPKRKPPVFGPVFERDGVYYNYRWDRHLAGSRDVISDECVTLHTQYSTQWDSLAHVGMLFDADGDGEPEPVYYNGWRAHDDIGGPPGSDRLGARALGIENMATACVQGRAVMIDLHARYGEERAYVDYDALMRAMDADAIAVEPGDFLLLHTGWDDLLVAMAGAPDAERLHRACAVLDGADERLLRWITDSGIVAIATDNMAVEDARRVVETTAGPSRLPLHRHCLFRLGVHLGELWYLSELAAALRAACRSRCLLTAPPLRLPGAVGSPVTPIATI